MKNRRISGAISSMWRRSDEKPTSAAGSEFTLYDGDSRLDAVGEASYQDALAIVLQQQGREFTAILLPEPANPYDPNAVAVLVDASKVGYLARADAARYHEPIMQLMQKTARHVAVRARIIGGEDAKPSLGVVIYHDPRTMGIPSLLDDAPPAPARLATTPPVSRTAATSAAVPGLDLHGQPYEARFNRARRAQRDVSELVGLCKGFLIDDDLSNNEVAALDQWIKVHVDGGEDWIVRQVARRVHAALLDGHISDEERADLRELITSFVGGTTELILGSDPRSTGLPLDDPPPELRWNGAVFVFTGKFAFGPRAECQRAALSLGAIVEDNITKRTDYLVIGTFGSRDWIQTSYGRKIQKAADYRAAGVPLAIVCEDHWRMGLP